MAFGAYLVPKATFGSLNDGLQGWKLIVPHGVVTPGGERRAELHHKSVGLRWPRRIGELWAHTSVAHIRYPDRDEHA